MPARVGMATSLSFSAPGPRRARPSAASAQDRAGPFWLFVLSMRVRVSLLMSRFKNLGDLIRDDADLTKIAIIDLGGEEAPREYTYAELDAMAWAWRAR